MPKYWRYLPQMVKTICFKVGFAPNDIISLTQDLRMKENASVVVKAAR
jgi:hypothetical protein